MNVASKPVHKELRGGGYHAVHKWLAKHFGKADKCENPMCKGISNTYHWAKLVGKSYEHNRDNFWMLCASCHRSYDMTDELIEKMANTLSKRTDHATCRNGHPRTEQNTYWAKRRRIMSAVCRDCRNESNRRYYARRQS